VCNERYLCVAQSHFCICHICLSATIESSNTILQVGLSCLGRSDCGGVCDVGQQLPPCRHERWDNNNSDTTYERVGITCPYRAYCNNY